MDDSTGQGSSLMKQQPKINQQKRGKNMKFEMINDTKKLCIRPAHLAMSDLENTEFLDIHVKDKALVIIPEQMNAMDMIRVLVSLSEICNELMAHLIESSGRCSTEECGVDSKDCSYMGTESFEGLEIPAELRKLAGFADDDRLIMEVDEENGVLTIYKKDDDDHDLSDVPEWVLKAFVALGGCLMELEEHLGTGEVLYGDD